MKASTYAEMLARTLTAQIYRDAAKSGIMETFGEYGDLVEILGRSKVDCGECKPFEGQILSLEGKTKGYTTIAEAREKGLFHPNCIHSFAITDNVIKIYKQYWTLNKFIDIASAGKFPLENEFQVGKINNTAIDYLKSKGIDVQDNNIKLTYKKVQHALRDSKNPLQKLSKDQLKRIDSIINQNNIYFDTKKKNLIYVAELPKDEIKNGRNWIKVPVNLTYKKKKGILSVQQVLYPTFLLLTQKNTKK